MCGRFVQNFAKEDLLKQFPDLLIDSVWLEKSGSSSFNVAPGDNVWVIDKADTSEKEILCRLQWGFEIMAPNNVPKKVINMRLDRLLESPNWKAAFMNNSRVLVPANGWFEWQKKQGKNQKNLPHYFAKTNRKQQQVNSTNSLLYFAALIDKHGNFGIVTQDASEDIASIHDRMPLILESEIDCLHWISKSTKEALTLLDKKMKTTPAIHIFNPILVSTKVNSVSNNDASLIREVPPPPTQGSLF
jgi:putative SOS response-associated peptidase YedK